MSAPWAPGVGYLGLTGLGVPDNAAMTDVRVRGALPAEAGILAEMAPWPTPHASAGGAAPVLYPTDDIDPPVGRRYHAGDGELRLQDPALQSSRVRAAHRARRVPAGRADRADRRRPHRCRATRRRALHGDPENREGAGGGVRLWMGSAHGGAHGARRRLRPRARPGGRPGEPGGL